MAEVINRLADRQGELSLGQRIRNLDALSSEEVDLLVVGGGIAGCGIALDAAARGLKTGLVEAGDYACGTSSRSTKLVHGGLRYLQYLELGLTREASAERRLLQRLAPGLVRPLPFILPAYGWGAALKYELGLWLYDAVASFRNFALHDSLGRGESLDRFPAMRAAGLTRSLRYYDAITDDARLTLQVAKTAASLGALLANHAKLVAFRKEGGETRGVIVEDVLGGKQYGIRARKVVLACGVWVDHVLALDDPEHKPLVAPSKGVTLVMTVEHFPKGLAFAIPVARDGRLVFAIPWYDRVLLSTTDTPHAGALEWPPVDARDVDYLLSAAADVFPGWGLSRQSIVSAQAGLRPLIAVPGKESVDLSRRERLILTRSGVIAVAGGKLTTYRPVARRVVDAALAQLTAGGRPPDVAISPTAAIPLTRRIGDASPMDHDPELGPASEYLPRIFSPAGPDVDGTSVQSEAGARPLIAGRPYIEEDVHHAIRHEQAATLTDFLARRVRAVLLDDQRGLGCAPRVAEIMAGALRWNESTRARMLEEFESVARAHGVT